MDAQDPRDHPSRHPAMRGALEQPARYGPRQRSGWIIGPGLLLLTILLPAPEGLSREAWLVAGIGGLMAAWWICESIPIPITALLPIICFPLFGIADTRAAAAPYANPIIYLFLGGFLIALAMERWKLHKRVALTLVGWLGTRPDGIIGGFLLASALLSMWVSNTATALMMLPIGLSVVSLLGGGGAFAPALMLSIAYGATIGGMGTLIGTPPLALLAGHMHETHGYEIGFGRWMLVGVPTVLAGLPLAWWVLARLAFQLPREPIPGAAGAIAQERANLGPPSYPEIAVAVVFILTAAGWIFQPLLAGRFPLLTDPAIALAGALALFIIPARRGKGVALMDWQTARKVPWDVLILFGGGLSLAAAVDAQGLSTYIGSFFADAGGWPPILLIAACCLGVLLLTELTSNTATAAAFLPVVGAVAIGMGLNPLFLLIPAAMAANCSFMMPVGTPPNAVVFGSGKIPLPTMVKTGIWLNALFLIVIVLAARYLAPLVFDG